MIGEIRSKFFDDVYAEVELGYDDEDIRSLSIWRLDNHGDIEGNPLVVIVDWNTNKYLLDMAIEVAETGNDGSAV
jgi:hypothetical protein